MGVSLSGGVAFGFAHIGVLKFFEETGIPVDAITGTSAGAIVGSLFAFGMPIDQIHREATQLRWSDLSHMSPSKMGPISNKSLGDLMLRLIGEKNIEDALIPLAITATDIRTGEQIVLRSGPVSDAVRASTAIPGIFTPVVLGEHLLVDGGLSNNLPSAPLHHLQMDIKIGVDVIAHSAKYSDPTNYFAVLANTYNIFIHRLNNQSRKGFDVLIDPEIKSMIMDISKAEQLIATGYHSAQGARGRILELIAEKTKPSLWGKVIGRKK